MMMLFSASDPDIGRKVDEAGDSLASNLREEARPWMVYVMSRDGRESRDDGVSLPGDGDYVEVVSIVLEDGADPRDLITIFQNLALDHDVGWPVAIEVLHHRPLSIAQDDFYRFPAPHRAAA
jgi:hypothetical protein